MPPRAARTELPEELRRRIVQADAWARTHWRQDDLERSPRSPELRPPFDEDGRPVISAASVDALARSRAGLLATVGALPTSLEPPVGGRLLAFDSGQSVSDGAAAGESNGFFDDDNTPAWDCWLLFVENRPRSTERWSPFDCYLLSWIPASLLELVERSVHVNPERCLRWADELGIPTAAGP
jgi:hypothetical protein